MLKFHYKYIISLLLLFPLVISARNQADIDDVLSRLDSVIDAAPQYESAKCARISQLTSKMRLAKAPMMRYKLNMQLYEEYTSYQSDSALHILENNYNIAKSMHRKDLENDCISLMAYQCTSSGRYPDAMRLLKKVDTLQLKGRGRFYFYRTLNHLFNEIGYYSHIKPYHDSAYAMAGKYEVLLLKSLNPNTADYKQYYCIRLFNSGKIEEALRVSDEWSAMTPKDSREFALVAYYKYIFSISAKDSVNAIYWLARSAISDITHSVMDQASLWSLAEYLSGKDLDRSYKYVSYSWRCATKFGASVRAAQISPVLSVIGAKYKEKLDNANHRLQSFLLLISVLAIVLLLLLYDVTKQRRHLAVARLRVRNRELAESNAMLAESIDNLKKANEHVTTINSQLQESDQIKEAYIGRFLTLCSDYINQMDKARREANKMIKAQKIDELYELTRTTKQKEKDVEQLYSYFDSTFLNIFPSFVEDFNALLKPEYRIDVPKGKLNTTLRIFALIRLGVDDSGKIAKFLHYSVNTIYNYRARIKNGSLGNRDMFEDEVKNLGKI